MAKDTKTVLLNEISALERQMRDGDKALLEYAKEISNLRDYIQARSERHDEMSKEIKTFELVCGAKANVIKDLGGELKIVRDLRSKNVMEITKLDKAIAQLGGVIGGMSNEIIDLSRRLELSEKFSGNKEFHNATEAMGNPQYFQRVSND